MNKQEAKADAGKLEIDLVPVQMVRDAAEVRMYGTAKYGDPDNWKRVELRRYINAMLRHTLAFWEDPKSVDEESGIPHYKHAVCNWAFICAMLAGKVDEQIETSVDAVEVTRCKDCKHRYESATTDLHCTISGMVVGDDDFCSYGERKEDAE